MSLELALQKAPKEIVLKDGMKCKLRPLRNRDGSGNHSQDNRACALGRLSADNTLVEVGKRRRKWSRFLIDDRHYFAGKSNS